MGFRAFLVMDNTVARQAMAENGRQWQKMVEKSSPRLFGRKWIFARFTSWPSRWPGRKWQEMAENGLPRLFGRKWIFAHLSPFPYYLFFYQIVYKGQTITNWQTNGREGFRALCAISLLLIDVIVLLI